LPLSIFLNIGRGKMDTFIPFIHDTKKEENISEPLYIELIPDIYEETLEENDEQRFIIIDII
jgi:hypothetical protein